MGRIKKVAGSKHEATLSPALSDFVSTATKLPLVKLTSHLQSFSSRWPYPRGDLYHWIPLLDLFDTILENFIIEYGLNDGPQRRIFGTRLLQRGVVEPGETTPDRSCSDEDLAKSDFGDQGDCELVEATLTFSRLLLENCGNRSLYASSDRLGYLLNTTSLSLLLATLRLASRLAIRYHHSRQRGTPGSQHLNNALLASHYNINLDYVQKLANVFSKSPSLGSASIEAAPPKSPSKGKEKPFNVGETHTTTTSQTSNMLQAAREDEALHWEENASSWARCGDVTLNYQQTSVTTDHGAEPSMGSHRSMRSPNMTTDPSTPTPTPTRRVSNLSRQSRTVQDNSQASTDPPIASAGTIPNDTKTIHVPHTVIVSTPLEHILDSRLGELPQEYHYEFLNQLRVAKYTTHSLHTRRDMISIRLLAITNLAYVYPEAAFHQKILQSDSDEPRRLQIVQQLAELVHPPDNDKAGVPVALKTIAVGTLEALCKHKARATDVCSALSINVSHGVLLFILRKTVSELAIDIPNEDTTESDEWQEALLSLLDTLPSSASRNADALVGAGLLEILVDVLKLRSGKAERIHHKVLILLNSLVHGVRDAFQSFVNAKGLDAISDLIAWEVTSSIARVKEGQGLSDRFKSQLTDYQMPYFQQQTLRWLFKFVNHMMTHGSAHFDRLLRNLIDSPPLLEGLRDVLANGKIFGSTIWSGAVNILSSFIHNEPTSYAVIAEAGLSRAFLDSISVHGSTSRISHHSDGETSRSAVIRKTSSTNTVSVSIIRARPSIGNTEEEETVDLSRQLSVVPAQGVLPATDAISAIPSAFGAICLNTNGLDMFLGSKALETFFEIFESPEHVKAMATETNLPKNLGQHFDELVRHHPRLKAAILHSVILMCARLSYDCKVRASVKGSGAKLYSYDGDDTSLTNEARPASEPSSSSHGAERPQDEDIVMGDSSSTMSLEESDSETQAPPTAAYIGVAAKFLSGFFDNQPLCGNFVMGGGLEFLLDLTTAPSLPYNFNNWSESQDLSHVLHLLIEYKPQLVLPALMKRTLETLDILEPLTSHSGNNAFFSDFTNDSGVEQQATYLKPAGGTRILKALVSIHTLCNVLQEAFMHGPYGTRSHHTLFGQLNLTDSYIRLCKALGRLYRVCVWEEILLQNTLSDDLKESTRVNGYGMGSEEANEVFGFISNTDPASELSESRDNAANSALRDSSATDEKPSSSLKTHHAAYRKNVQSLRFLLSQVPSAITPFLQGLGRSLVSKRRADSYQRQNAYMVADTLAEVALDHLKFSPPSECTEVKDRFAYWIVALTSLSQLLIEGPVERAPQCLTLVLQAFRNLGGLECVNDILGQFFKKIQELTDETKPDAQASGAVGLLSCLYGGMRLILILYTQITSQKYTVDSAQSQALVTPDRDMVSPYYFNPAQFLVEIRFAVISAVRPIWDTSAIDSSSSVIIRCIIDILRTILEADAEVGAFTVDNKARERTQPEYKIFVLSREKLDALKGKGISDDLAREALYRCFNSRESAEEYCDAHARRIGAPSLQIPVYDIERATVGEGSQRQVRRHSSSETIPDADVAVSDESARSTENASEREASASNSSPAARPTDTEARQTTAGVDSPQIAAPDTDTMADSIDNILSLSEGPALLADQNSDSGSKTLTPFRIDTFRDRKPVSVEDLDNIRSQLRKNFIDRVLDVLRAHEDLSFDLADLINTAATKAQDADTLRKEIGETLVQSLISFQFKDDFRPEGKTIASYANLLAIVLQEHEFYEAALDEVKDNIDSLLNFVKLFPDQSPDEKSPWVAQVLLVIEKLLAEDGQPEQIRWTPPSTNSPEPEAPIAQSTPSLVSLQDKRGLFNSTIEMLPRVGKDSSLATSIVRILVILTRNRELADLLGEKRNMNKLFMMIRQLAGLTNEKFQSSILLVLRHIVEDDDTLKGVMRNEITGLFQNRSARPVDTTTFVRHMHALVLRSPKIFLEITNELLKLESFDPNARSQILVLREQENGSHSEQDTSKDDEITDVDPDSAVEHPTNPSLEEADDRSKISELRSIQCDQSDSVIHFLISQLYAYKEVDDGKVLMSTPKDNSGDQSQDIEMASLATTQTQDAPQAGQPEEVGKKNDKPDFKATDHPLYVYRCFILQCLTELLMSYSRAKIEFLHYSRKVETKTSTPFKPRSGVLSHILSSLVPIDSLDRLESIPFKKAVGTSNWAMSTIVALCLKTKETPMPESHRNKDETADAEISFIRKFVLEHVLKAFKDCLASHESLESKYARLLSLADLFSRLLSGRVLPITPVYAHEPQSQTIKEIAKIMFEKNYVAALTTSIADIDLNYPNAKRAVKYILRPLKTLTEMAVQLSESSELSAAPGQADDEEISSATSASDVDDNREETPDLFRHSTLGILDLGGRDERSSSASDDEDEDMYDDEYDEGMDYDEDIDRDNDEVVSDEDDELGDAGPVEGLSGDVDMGVEVVIDGEDGTEDMLEDSDDDDEEEVEIIDESLSDDDGQDWDAEENLDLDDSYPLSAAPAGPTLNQHDLGHQEVRGPPRDLALHMSSGDSASGDEPIDLEVDVENGRYVGALDMDINHAEEELDEEEDEDEELDEEDMVYPDYDDDGEDLDPSPWGLGAEDELAVRGPRNHHHHNHVRRIMSPWSMFTPGYSGSDRVPNYRTHRSTSTIRGQEDGLNPLLQRHGNSSATANRRANPIVAESAGLMGDFVNLLSSRHRHDGVVSILNGMMTTVGVPPFTGAHGGALHLHLDTNGGLLPFTRDLQALMSNPRPLGDTTRPSREDSSFIPLFYPTQTSARWSEEARMLFGAAYNDKTQRIVNSLLKLLVPPAMEEEQRRKEEKAEEARKQREIEETERQERLAREEAERIMRENKEREEREAAELADAQRRENGEQDDGTSGGPSDEMEGVEHTSTETTSQSLDNSDPAAIHNPGSSAQPDRVRAVFRGREVDITHLGIDLEYLDALPEELREEVLMQQLAEQRSQAAVSGEAPTDINREFLDALPHDIRQEILQQEAHDRRRREREESRRQAAASGGVPAARAEEMDTASFLASLDPGLRSAVLLDQDEDIISQLPAAIAAEARALGADRVSHRWDRASTGQHGGTHRPIPGRQAPDQEDGKKGAKRQVVQMLDKAGIATLLRLLFVSQQGSSHEYLKSILENASRNVQNRNEILGIILTILQEGSSDAPSVERSFAQLSLRAKQVGAPKTPQSLKRTPSGTLSPQLSPDMTPMMVIQQCLGALVHLTEMNAHVPVFFLSEHEQPLGVRTKLGKKGKSKEMPGSKFAINTLLSLLDRRLITDSAGCMEQLSSLMQTISQPLMTYRKEMDRARAMNEGDNEATHNSSTQDNGQDLSELQHPAGSIEVVDGENNAAEPSTKGPVKEASSKTGDAIPKKLRNFKLPVVPEQNYRLVVSILGARECSSKTFRDTLSTINNLSTIPGARNIFGTELVKVSQSLGDTITKDLDLLISQIQGSSSTDDIHGMALSKFSPSSSNQAKLLRVLTALDYLFDPNRSIGRSVDNDPDSSLKEDLVSTLYESSAFGPLWSRLSECLKCMRQRDNMLNTATVLLPLVEALMVVCKNTTLRETATQPSKEFTVTSPAPESSMKSLFFHFTEEHRKILNDLVRNNPRLMSGTFSLLVKNPKVLEFDNKRNYFTRRLHARGDLRQTQPSLQLSIRRDQTFLDSYKSLYFKSPKEMKYGKLSIRFHGEEGVDAGGVTREWFQTMSRQMFNADYALFVPVASDRTTFHPNRLSHVNEEHLFYFKFIGRVIGKALYEGRALDCHFSRAVYKRILGKSVSVKDMETLDLEYYKSLLWMLENDISDIITETFSIETEVFGVTEVIDLVENGRNIPVTEENKQEYVQLVVEYRLTGSVQAQLEEFLKGFHDIVPAELISIFNEQELELLISGLPDIDVDDWKNNTEYHNYSASSAQIQWFWRAVRSFDKEEQAKLLQFVTGTAKVPLNGFKELEGMNGFSRFNIHRDYGNKSRLPSSHTCFNQIDLPEYDDYETLRKQLYTAMTAGGDYFGFA